MIGEKYFYIPQSFKYSRQFKLLYIMSGHSDRMGFSIKSQKIFLAQPKIVVLLPKFYDYICISC